MYFRSMSSWIGIIGLTLIVALFAVPTGNAFGQNDASVKRGPERLITMAVEYPGVIVSQGNNIEMEIIIKNKGRQDENLYLEVADKPDGWDAVIKTYSYEITGVYIPADDDRKISLKINPADDVAPGNYVVAISGKTDDNVFKLRQRINIQIQEHIAEVVEKGIKLTTSYPEIKGPSDGSFEFSIEVKSELDEEAVFNLLAQGPTGWDINIKPAYETKYISSLRLKANQSQTIAVEVKPVPLAEAGHYPISLRVSSGAASAESKLSIILTGTYKLDVGTADGLLSLDARQGKPSNMSFYIRNTGSAANHNIELMSFQPENWKVEFKPEKFDIIEPGDLVQVEMTITPYDEALIGDYSVDVKVKGEKADQSLKFRTSVKASAVWGWVGIVIIVIVIIGLFVIFRVFGRR